MKSTLLGFLCRRCRLGGGAWFARSRCCRRTNERGGLDGIQLQEALIQIGFALALEQALIRPGVAILIVKHLHDLHPLTIHQAKWRKALAVPPSILFQVDEHLRRACVWSTC